MVANQSSLSPVSLDVMVDGLKRMSAELTAFERGVGAEQLVPAEVVFRDPLDTYHHINLGAVLAAYGLSANDARRLDGFLAMRPLDVLDDDGILGHWKSGLVRGKTVGEALLIFLDCVAGLLEDHGRYAEWRRKYDDYIARTKVFLKSLDEEMLVAMLRKPPSRKQLWLVRYTVECLGVEFPELSDRRAAFIWLRDVGANPRYRRAR